MKKNPFNFHHWLYSHRIFTTVICFALASLFASHSHTNWDGGIVQPVTPSLREAQIQNADLHLPDAIAAITEHMHRLNDEDHGQQQFQLQQHLTLDDIDLISESVLASAVNATHMDRNFTALGVIIYHGGHAVVGNETLDMIHRLIVEAVNEGADYEEIIEKHFKFITPGQREMIKDRFIMNRNLGRRYHRVNHLNIEEEKAYNQLIAAANEDYGLTDDSQTSSTALTPSNITSESGFFSQSITQLPPRPSNLDEEKRFNQLVHSFRRDDIRYYDRRPVTIAMARTSGRKRKSSSSVGIGSSLSSGSEENSDSDEDYNDIVRDNDMEVCDDTDNNLPRTEETEVIDYLGGYDDLPDENVDDITTKPKPITLNDGTHFAQSRDFLEAYSGLQKETFEESDTSFRAFLARDIELVNDLEEEVRNNPEMDVSALVERLKQQRDNMVDEMKENLPGHLHDEINMANKFSSDMLVLFYLHYAPTNSKPDDDDLVDYCRKNQCCIATMKSKLPNYLHHENAQRDMSIMPYGGRTEIDETDKMAVVDLSPFLLEKEDVKQQYKRWADLLKLESIEELFIITYNMARRHLILHELAHPEDTCQVHAASSATAEYILGEKSGSKKYVKKWKEVNNNYAVTVGAHPQCYLMGVCKSHRLFPEEVRKIMMEHLVEVYSTVLTFDADFETKIMDNFGGDWADGVDLAVYNHLAKVFDETDLLMEDHQHVTNDMVRRLPPTDLALFENELKDNTVDKVLKRMRGCRAGHTMKSLVSKIFNNGHLAWGSEVDQIKSLLENFDHQKSSKTDSSDNDQTDDALQIYIKLVGYRPKITTQLHSLAKYIYKIGMGYGETYEYQKNQMKKYINKYFFTMKGVKKKLVPEGQGGRGPVVYVTLKDEKEYPGLWHWWTTITGYAQYNGNIPCTYGVKAEKNTDERQELEKMGLSFGNDLKSVTEAINSGYNVEEKKRRKTINKGGVINQRKRAFRSRGK